MKLYKIIKIVGDHGVSVFEPYDIPEDPLDPAEASQYSESVNRLKFVGLTDVQAGKMVYAWMQYAKIKLGMTTSAAYAFARECAGRVTPEQVAPGFELWPVIIVVAVIVAVALGLYVWAVLDQESNVTFGAHPWAYVTTYESRMWQAEVMYVTPDQRGVYEVGGSFGDVIGQHHRDYQGVSRKDWFWVRPGSVVLGGRHPILYHKYVFRGFFVFFCGLLTHINPRLYKLREGGNDPYMPTGVWWRPGGYMFTPDYEGCWKEWWWF